MLVDVFSKGVSEQDEMEQVDLEQVPWDQQGVMLEELPFLRTINSHLPYLE